MEKKRLFRILARADAATVAAMAERLQAGHSVTVVREPSKTLAMVKLRETAESSLFYLGEVIVWEASVTLDGERGMAVTMGNIAEKALHMAIIDAAVNSGVFEEDDALLALEAEQGQQLMRENALHRQTLVSFTSIDTEMPT